METILIADDEEQNRFYLETLFKAGGFHVTVVSNGKQALESAKKSPPQLIISDILMPVMDGFMLCRKWKNDSNLKKIPFIFYTATYTEPKDEKLAKDMGADLFILKPQEPDTLMDIVKKVLDESKSKIAETAAKTKIPEESVLKDYNEILFQKLETKIQQLEMANRTIKNSEIRYRSIFRNSLAGIFQINRNGQILVSNPALYHMLGYGSLDEMTTTIKNIGLNLYVNKEDHDKLLELLKQNNYVDGYETGLRKKDGNIIWVKANIWIVRDDYNHILYYEGIVNDITDRIQKEENLITSAEKLKNAMLGTIKIVATIVEQRDPYTSGHQYRVAELARAIAEELNLYPQQVEGIRVAGLIHDVGKISIPAEILTKPSKLSPVEFTLVQTHAEAGYNILKGIEFPWPIADAIHQHHERINGSGYPKGLSKAEIIPEALILAVSDVVEAMVSHRPYRPAFGIDIALKEIEDNTGILYDEDVTKACINLFRNKGFKLPDGWK